MIKREEIYKIGVFNKPHGIHGELSFTFTDDIFDRVDCEYLVCEVDGIFVPFFINEYRFRSDSTALIFLEGIDSAEKARPFTNLDVYFPQKYADRQPETPSSWDYFIGFRISDIQHGELGEVTYIDDSTQNVLFVVEREGNEILIPANEDFMVQLDKMHRSIVMNLPEGLLEL